MPSFGTPVSFEIRSRPTGDGFNLSCPGLLAYSLWFKEISSAVSYARWAGQRHETTIKVYRRDGSLVKERTFPATDINF